MPETDRAGILMTRDMGNRGNRDRLVDEGHCLGRIELNFLCAMALSRELGDNAMLGQVTRKLMKVS